MNNFSSPPNVPALQGPENIRFDFNHGARVLLPEGDWHVEISDEDTDNILFTGDVTQGWVTSTKKYYVRFRIKVWKRGNHSPLLDHTLNLEGQPVLISFPVGTLGDLIGWVPYAERFRQLRHSKVHCIMDRKIIEVFEPAYPGLNFHTPDEYSQKIAEKNPPYATYRIGLFFGGNDTDQPFDFRQTGLHRTAGHILGVDATEIIPELVLNAPRKIQEPYVCIATKSTCQAKFWNNGTGWNEVISFLKEQGYRVLSIDRDATVGHGFVWNHTPAGAEDFTGNLPLQERIALLQHAEFFIGLGSGLSWLAWACRIPVVLISGFSLPGCEFSTPYRVINTHVCNGCWDDCSINFDHKDYLWCPRHKGSERQFECTRFITGKQVIGHIRQLIKDKNSHGM